MEKPDQIRYYRALGEKIMKARLEVDIKQEAFGKLLKLTRTSIINIEKGRQHPSIHLLWDISKVVNKDISELLPEFMLENKVSPQRREIIEEIDNSLSRIQLTNFIIETER